MYNGVIDSSNVGLLGSIVGNIEFFPTIGFRSGSNDSYSIPIHAWTYRYRPSKFKNFMVDSFGKILSSELAEEVDMPHFRGLAEMFVVTASSGRSVRLHCGDRVYHLGKSSLNGHLRTVLTLPSQELGKIFPCENEARESEARENKNSVDVPRDRWLTLKTANGGSSESGPNIQLLNEEGVSVISDIDDTIKVSNVSDKKALLQNTFLRRYEAVPGLAEVYQAWRKKGAAFHYVSSSPWQLYRPLAEFLERENFPRGSFHLTPFCWRDFSWLQVFASARRTKPRAIEPLVQQFPKRKFILVGDTSEKDPEIYGDFARKYPSQISRLCIHAVPGTNLSEVRFAQAFKDISPAKWLVFSTAAELGARVPRLRCESCVSKLSITYESRG